MKVYILFSIANQYDQPEKAFEKLFWNKPTFEDLKPYGFSEEEYHENMFKRNIGGCGKFWVEEFININ